MAPALQGVPGRILAALEEGRRRRVGAQEEMEEEPDRVRHVELAVSHKGHAAFTERKVAVGRNDLEVVLKAE